jgi:hypothetical protein
MRSMQCILDFGYQLSICSMTEEMKGKFGSIGLKTNINLHHI